MLFFYIQINHSNVQPAQASEGSPQHSKKMNNFALHLEKENVVIHISAAELIYFRSHFEHKKVSDESQDMKPASDTVELFNIYCSLHHITWPV